MKQILGAVLTALLLAGCGRTNPVDSQSAVSDQTSVVSLLKSDAAYGEMTMYVATVADELTRAERADSGIHIHDSLRHARMLDSLIAHLGLSAAQADSIKAYGAALLAALKDIKTQVESGAIKRDSAMSLVRIARDQFVASVRSILTADQLTLFQAWLERFWNRPPRGRGGDDGPHGPGGRGRGRGGPGGPGGHR